ncbi:hypothetical protein RIF29_35148 [Crotalaria pallida]|uniref:Non-specific lipid-transfer protein n=1 Tax=Crotalaria pallida TaxID=3830 RepID=A0AAN9EC92_CROPI
MASIKVACVVLMCMVVVGARITHANLTCEVIVRNLVSCVPYLQFGGNPSLPCCTGCQNVAAQAKTPADRQTACKCLKSAAASIPGYVDANAVALPSKCHVNIPYKFSTSTDCATYVTSLYSLFIESLQELAQLMKL